MNDEAKIIGVIGAIVLIVFGGFVVFATKGKTNNTTATASVDTSLLIRSDSHETSPKAAISIVEFGDYQCPSCGEAHPIIKEVLKQYGNKINFVFRNFPLTQHPNALPGAEAAEAAGAQGKYWEMHDKLYENQDKWSGLGNPIDTFTGYAKELGLDTDKFKKEVEEKKYNDFILKDLADGNLIAINATPTFFVNGSKIVGVPNLNELKSTIDALLTSLPSPTPTAIPINKQKR